jgi:hypothetical protein
LRFRRRKRTVHQQGHEEGRGTFDNYGISLAHLASLPIPAKLSFNDACAYIKEKTKGSFGYRSYARYLMSNKRTKHLVKENATVFVSYAWSGGFGPTMSALMDFFGEEATNTFVWMDFVIVDQHATHDIDFEQWSRIFRENLLKTQRAILVLTPGEKPVAVTRAWCCFEWVTIVETGISFDYCVPKSDEAKLIKRLQNGMGLEKFNNLFADINVEKAEAFKKTDLESILGLMKQVGVVKVNDIVLKSLKKWLVDVSKNAESQCEVASPELACVLNARASLCDALVSF